MSHVVTVQTEVSDLEAVRAAAEAMGGTFHVDQKTHQSYYSKEKCDHAISFPGASYEVGIKVGGDGKARLAYDPYPTGGLGRVLGGQKAEKLMQNYAAEKVKKNLKRKGYHVGKQIMLADGSMRVEMEK